MGNCWMVESGEDAQHKEHKEKECEGMCEIALDILEKKRRKKSERN